MTSRLPSLLRSVSLVSLLLAPAAAFAAPMTFAHLAGTTGGYGFEDGPYAKARFWEPANAACDSAGNVYISDRVDATIRKLVWGSGEVRTLAGLSCTRGTADGRGADARFWDPAGVAVDSHDNVYVADNAWHTIRKVTPAGDVTTFAGTPIANGEHADGVGAEARFTNPYALAFDSSDNLYVGDGSRIRKITPAGSVTTLAGNGTHAVVDGIGPDARIFAIGGMAWDASTNTLVFTESQSSVVRRVTLPGASVSTIAGAVDTPGHANGNGTDARFRTLGAIAASPSGTLWITQTSGLIRTMSPSGDVADLAGADFSVGAVNGIGSAARFSSAFGIAYSRYSGAVYVCDPGNHVIRGLSGSTVNTIAGTLPTSGIINGAGADARFNSPSGLAVDAAHAVVYVADTGNNAIRRVTLPDGTTTTVAGSGAYGFDNGNGTSATFNAPQGVAFDAADGSLYVADTNNNCIRRIASNGDVTTFAGDPNGISGSANGDRLTSARFYGPAGLVLDPPRHRMVIADAYNHKLRSLDLATGVVVDVVRSTDLQPVDFGGLTVDNVSVDGSGNLYVGCGNKITKITPAGVVSVVAGAGDNYVPGPGSPYDGTGTQARFSFPGPSTVSVDADGNGYVADIWASTIRSLTSAGAVETVAGLLSRPGSADGTGTAAQFNFPRAVARYGDRVIVADAYGLRISVPQIPDTITAPTSVPIGAPFGLGTSPQTATSWQWTMIRRPASSNATLTSNGNGVLFTPDVPDVYQFRVAATGPAGTSMTTAIVTAIRMPDHFLVSVANGSVVAGTPASVTVQIVDGVGAPMDFTGMIHFTSSDPDATLPADYMLVPGDHGGHTFSPVFRHAGFPSITATEARPGGTLGTLTGSAQFLVVAAAASSLSLACPSPSRSGVQGLLTVTATDPYGNPTPSYAGKVHFLSSDANATLPADFTFSGSNGGSALLSATLRKAGAQTITVYDVANPSQLHATANVVVTSPLVAGDLDHNGSSDLYWRNDVNGANAMWLMNGASLYLVVNLPALPNPSYRLQGVADFDGDGEPDLVWRNATTGANALWLMTGTSIKAIVNLPALPNPDYQIAGAADFDGDGDPDLLWRNYANGANALWIMNGTSFSSIVNLPSLPNTDYHLESAADFDGNGKPDIVWRNYTTGANALWLMDGTSFSGTIVNLPALPNVQYRIGAVGDYDGDGKADLVWRNPNTGANAIWKMNGTALAGVIDLPALGNPAYSMAGAR